MTDTEDGSPEPPATTTSDDAAPQAQRPIGFLAELHDAVSPRTVALVFGVLLLQLAFILSYVGAFHSPKPHRITVAVVAPAAASAQLVDRVNSLSGSPLKAHAVDTAAQARRQVSTGSASAALIVNGAGTSDQLLVSSGGGSSVVTAVEQVATAVETAQHRTVTTTDLVPLQSGDSRGLTGFYLVIGWIVGGYLVSALLGITAGSRPATPRRAVIRLLSLVPYAILSGVFGALIVDQVLGALTGHFVALWWLGALVVLGTATVTMAFQILLGVLGIGVTVLVFVVLGNPSAGGAYQPALLPPFWRAISGALPNGAATDTVRRIVYFGGHGIGTHLLVLCLYAVAGVVATLGASVLIHRRAPASPRLSRASLS